MCPEKGTCISTNCGVDASACSKWKCGDGFVCDPITFHQKICASYVIDAPDTLMNPEAAACALEALQNGTPGWITWGGQCDPQFLVAARHDLHIGAGRIGLFAGEDDDGMGYAYSKKGPMTLKGAGYFADCMMKTQAQDIWNCLEGWSDGCLK